MSDSLPRYTMRISRLLLDKLHYVAEYNGRTMNKELELLVRNDIAGFEAKYGPIDLSKPPREE